MELAKDVGKLIKESAEAEAAGMRAQAIASMVSGAINAVGAAVSLYGATGRGQLKTDGKYDMARTHQKWQAVNQMFQGLSQTASAVGTFEQSRQTVLKGLKDQLKTIMEQVKSIVDRGIGTAGEERGQLQQQITQLLEQLSNLLRSYMTAKHIERQG